jgi:hypothetical protein
VTAAKCAGHVEGHLVRVEQGGVNSGEQLQLVNTEELAPTQISDLGLNIGGVIL